MLGNDQPFVDKVKAAAGRTDESIWQLPLAKEYRKLLDSQVADMKNIGGPYGGAITAALFLSEFVGSTPVGAPRHRRPDGRRRRRRLAVAWRHRLRHPHAHRPRHLVHPLTGRERLDR